MKIKEPKTHTRSILRKVLPKYCKGIVLDVGAGRAKYRPLIIEYADKYITTDNATSSDQFKDDQVQNKLDIICDVTEIPLEDNSIDTEICTEVIEHVPDPFKLMQELSRLLKSGGYLILSSGWMAPYHPEPKDYFRFSPDAYTYLCDINKFKVIEIISKGGFFTFNLYLYTRVIDLHGNLSKKIMIRLKPIVTLLEIFFGWLDSKIKSNDTIGHLVVAQKI